MPNAILNNETWTIEQIHVHAPSFFSDLDCLKYIEQLTKADLKPHETLCVDVFDLKDVECDCPKLPLATKPFLIILATRIDV